MVIYIYMHYIVMQYDIFIYICKWDMSSTCFVIPGIHALGVYIVLFLLMMMRLVNAHLSNHIYIYIYIHDPLAEF